MKFFKLVKSEKLMLFVAFVFMLVMAVYSFYDVAVDKTDLKAYSKTEVESFEVELLNINEADVSELCELEGVGESVAKEIIEYRTENNGFKSIEEIQEVKGIGFQDYIKIAPLITVG